MIAKQLRKHKSFINEPDVSKELLKKRLLAQRKIDGDGCWLWCGHTTGNNGYGKMCYLGITRAVHRLAAFIWMGFDLDSSLCVLHKCDKPICFRPKCLFVGTHLDNMRDSIAKGRHGSVRMRLKTHLCKWASVVWR